MADAKKEKTKEWRGIRGLVAAKVLSNTAEGATWDKPFPVAGVATLTRTTESSTESHYYDNEPAVTIDSKGADEVTIGTSAIPFDVLAKLSGQYYDEAKGMFVEMDGIVKDQYAIGYITKKTDGTEVFVWRLVGTFNIPDNEHNTEDDGSEANGQELVYTGIPTKCKYESIGDKAARATTVDTSVNPITEEEFFSKVYDPDTVPPVA